MLASQPAEAFICRDRKIVIVKPIGVSMSRSLWKMVQQVRNIGCHGSDVLNFDFVMCIGMGVIDEGIFLPLYSMLSLEPWQALFTFSVSRKITRAHYFLDDSTAACSLLKALLV